MRLQTCDEAPDHWKVCSIESVALRVTSGGTPSRKRSDYYTTEHGIPWVKTQELLDTTVYDTEEHLTELGLSESSAKLLPKDTLLVAMYAAPTAGRMAILGREMTCNQAACAIVPDPTQILTRWLFYQLLSNRSQLHRLANGAAQQNLSGALIKGLELPVPPLAEQRAIAGVLGALDDKIESNRRIASSCELLARVQLEDALGGSGEVVSLGTLARFRNSERKPLSAIQRNEMVGKRVYPYFGATGVFDYVDDYLFDDLTVLVGEDGSVVNDDGSPVVQLAWGKYWVNNHAHVLVGEGITSELLYVALKRSDVRPLVTGAVQAKISMGNLRTLELELPGVDTRMALGGDLRLVMGRMRKALDENRALAEFRDALLPELLSGRLRVSDAEGVLEEAL